MLHDGYKLFSTNKNVKCLYYDGVNYQFEDGTMLESLLNKCAEHFPDRFVFYEAENPRKYRGMNGEHYWLVDINIVYSPKKVSSRTHKFDTEVVVDVAHTSTGRPYVTGQHRERVLPVAKVSSRIYEISPDLFKVKGTIFSGTYDECERYIKYVRTAPECYRNRAAQCPNWAVLVLRTDISGKCAETKYTAQKMPKSAESFHRRMSGGNRYAY